MRDTSGEHHYRGGTMKRLLEIIEARFVSHLARMECRIMSNIDEVKTLVAGLLSNFQTSRQQEATLLAALAAHPAVAQASTADADLQSLVDSLKAANADELKSISDTQIQIDALKAPPTSAPPAAAADTSTGSASADAGATGG